MKIWLVIIRILIVGLVLLVIVVMVAGYIRNRRLQKEVDNRELDNFPEVREADTEYCGQYKVCEWDSLLAAVNKQIEYYDDEELDTFIDRVPEEYTSEETDKFHDIFYTIQDTDVVGWACGL